MNFTSFRWWHRKLGLVFVIFAVMASVSGLLHVWMAHNQEPPPRPVPHGATLSLESKLLPLEQAAKSLPADEKPIVGVNLRVIQDRTVFVFWRESRATPVYVDAKTGEFLPDFDEVYAAEIASRFFGGKPVKKSEYLTKFNREYIAIFRILPVYRMEVGDDLGTRLYVSTKTEGVTRHTDNQRQFEADFFSLIHKFMFIPNKTAREWTLITGTAGILLVSLLGLGLYFRKR